MHLSNKNNPLKLIVRTSLFFLVLIGLIACSTPNSVVPDSSVDQEEIPDLPDLPDSPDSTEVDPVETLEVKYLALGDSYTIGTGVCNSCNYPVQLKDSLLAISDPIYEASVEIIAQSGWTTTRLLEEIENSNLGNNFDLVTLLIGVNNQFQNKPFELYEEEFITLLNRAIKFAQDNDDRVMVISIPDYAFSIFGQGWGDPETTTIEIDNYNAYAKSVCDSLNIPFINITDISREALDRTELLASDGLHLSELAYSEVVERLLPIVREKLEND